MDTQAITSSAPAAIAPGTPVLPQTAVRTGNTQPVKGAGSDDTSEPTSIEVPARDPRSLNYQVDKDTQKVVVTIVDEGNKLVIRQIPDAEVLRIAREIDRMQGFLLESKA